MCHRSLAFGLLLVLFAVAAAAQSTSFSYQGVIKQNNAPANGDHYFEFALYDQPTFGTQIGSTIIKDPVSVTLGVFSVDLDFGNQFDGSNRYLEIRVRPSGGGILNVLSPRQLIMNAPNALNANSLGGLPAASYIQNTITQQANANLNIGGNAVVGGNVGVGTKSPTANLNIVGTQPPDAVGLNAPGQNATDALNIAGARGGRSGDAGQGGHGANISIRAGDGGTSPQGTPAEGDGGSITLQAGLSNKPNGNGQILIAPEGGNIIVPSTSSKVAIGTSSPASAALTVVNPAPGITNGSPSNLPPAAIRGEATSTTNTNIGVLGIGNGANGIGTIGLTNGTGTSNGNNAIGVLAVAPNTTGETIGISSEVTSPDGTALDIHVTSGGTGYLIRASSGTSEGTSSSKFTVNSNGLVVANAGIWAKGFHLNSTIADLLENGDFITGGTVSANGVDTTSNITVGGQIFGNGGTLTIGSNMNINGTVTPQLLSGGDNNLCNLTGTSTLRFCSSSLRYKTNVQPFLRGLDLIKQLNPIRFDWKENGLHDVGLAAEEMKRVEPRLTFDNPKGEVEGVKYSNLAAVFVNAFKEQQAQIDAQNKLIAQQARLLKKFASELKSLKRKVNSRRRR